MSPRLHFHFVTLFPEVIEVWLTTSILGRAHQAGLFAFSLYSLREYSTDKHRSVDDVAYGGGGGMVLKVEPLVAAVDAIRKSLEPAPVKIIYLSPAGAVLSQSLVESLRPEGDGSRHFILICGHYEGVDQRFIDHWVDLEVSMGDFVLTGGELPALALADALIRQLDGALGGRDACATESFALRGPSGREKLLEYPHYTRPAEFRGIRVPEILLSGDHQKVDSWREAQARERTRHRRPDLLLTKENR